MFDVLFRGGIGLMKTLFSEGGLMATVQHYPAELDGNGDPVLDAFGDPTLLAPTGRLAVVTDTDAPVRNEQGETLVAAYAVQFLEVVPVNVHDVIALPDGRSAPVRRVDAGTVDSAGVPLLTLVVCG